MGRIKNNIINIDSKILPSNNIIRKNKLKKDMIHKKYVLEILGEN
jgi:hypothetical protein